MPLVVTHGMADGQIGLVAVAAFAQGLNMFERGVHHVHMLATHPARHLAVQLASDGVVDFLAGVGWFAHLFVLALFALVRPSALPMRPASCPPGFALLLALRGTHGRIALCAFSDAKFFKSIWQPACANWANHVARFAKQLRSQH